MPFGGVGECYRRENFISSQMRRNEKDCKIYCCATCFLSGRKGEQLLQHKFEIYRFFSIYGQEPVSGQVL
jgi:hypothetical protein